MILLVDDEEIVRIITSELLNYLGYSVEVCPNGGDAILLFRENYPKIDLVILDMVMPGMRGTIVFEELKKIDPAVKVLFLSGYSHDHEVEEILTKGAAGYLKKPVSLDELGKKIKEVLGT